jgi:hypothetical protein
MNAHLYSDCELASCMVLTVIIIIKFVMFVSSFQTLFRKSKNEMATTEYGSADSIDPQL